MKTSTIIFFLLLLFFSSLTAFGSGFGLSQLLKKEIEPPPVSSTPFPSTSPSPSNMPNRDYFEDEIYIISTSLPRKILIMSLTYTPGDNSYIQNQRVSYFNGTDWNRNTDTRRTAMKTFMPSSFLLQYKRDIDSSRVLQETIEAEFNINSDSIHIHSKTLENEIGMRSLPEYTKFMSEGETIFTINGEVIPARIFSTKIYSLNVDRMQFYTNPIGITTDWLAFWDSEGNFYHIDSTDVKKPTPLYSSHHIAVKKSKTREISKIFSADIQRNSEIPPSYFKFVLPFYSPLTIETNTISKLNKYPNSSSQWYLMEVSGTVQKNGNPISGYGIIEYIKD